MKKKKITTLLALTMAFSLVMGCGAKSQDQTTTETVDEAVSEEAAE